MDLRLIPGFVLSVVFLVVVLMAPLAIVGYAFSADRPATKSEQRAAVRAHDAKKRMTRKQFERSLLSPIGKGRLE